MGALSTLIKLDESCNCEGESRTQKSPSCCFSQKQTFDSTLPIISSLNKVDYHFDLPLISSFDDNEFKNEYEAIRCKFVKNGFFNGVIGLSDVVNLYRTWRDDAEYFILCSQSYFHQETFDRDRTSYLGNVGIIKTYIGENKYKFIKASKRGNDVYKYLVDKKLKPINELQNVLFFKEDWGDKHTSLLFITLTYAIRKCLSCGKHYKLGLNQCPFCKSYEFIDLSPSEAWKNIGVDYHLFCNKLRKKYGHIEFFRTWETTENFYPHVHVLIGFKNKDFSVFEHTDKKGKKTFRISKQDKDKINSFWHSNSDIQGISETDDATKELTKYITKDLCSAKGDKTNDMIWLFGKQSYAVSRGFVGLIKGCFAEITESQQIGDVATDDLINVMSNCNQQYEKWEFVGILRGVQLGVSSDLWSFDVKKPPPAIVELIEKERMRWATVHGGRY